MSPSSLIAVALVRVQPDGIEGRVERSIGFAVGEVHSTARSVPLAASYWPTISCASLIAVRYVVSGMAADGIARGVTTPALVWNASAFELIVDPSAASRWLPNT